MGSGADVARVAVVAYGTILVAYVVLTLFRFFLLVWKQHWRNLAFTILPPNWLWGGNASGHHAKAEGLARSRRLARGRSALGLMTHGSAAVLVALLAARHIDMAEESIDAQPGPGDMPLPFAAGLLVFGTFFQMAPGQLSTRRLDCLHVLAMARLVWQVAETQSRLTLIFRSRGAAALRLCLGLALGNGPLTTVLNVTFCTASVWAYSGLEEDGSAPDEDLGPWHLAWYILPELLMALAIAATVGALESCSLAEAQTAVQVGVASTAEAAANKLLLGLCDAVVPLCPDLRVLPCASQLTPWLPRQAPGGDAAGLAFLDLVDEADRGRALEHLGLRGEGGEPERAVPLTLNMLDTEGSCIKVQLFSADFVDAEKRSCHLLGVRELCGGRDEAAVSVRDAAPETGGAPQPQPAAEGDAGPGGPGAAAGALGLASTSSPGRPRSVPGTDLGASRDQETEVTFDVSTFKVLHCSPDFTFGHSAPLPCGTCLSEWLVRGENDWFFQDIRMAVESLTYENSLGISNEKVIKSFMVFRDALNLSERSRISLSCSITLNMGEGADLEGGPDSTGTVARAVVLKATRKVKGQRKRRSDQSKTRSRGTSSCSSDSGFL